MYIPRWKEVDYMIGIERIRRFETSKTYIGYFLPPPRLFVALRTGHHDNSQDRSCQNPQQIVPPTAIQHGQGSSLDQLQGNQGGSR